MKNEKFESNNIIEDLLNKKNELLTASENLLNELQEIHDNVGKIKEYFLNHIDTNQNSIHEIQKINHSILFCLFFSLFLQNILQNQYFCMIHIVFEHQR